VALTGIHAAGFRRSPGWSCRKIGAPPDSPLERLDVELRAPRTPREREAAMLQWLRPSPADRTTGASRRAEALIHDYDARLTLRLARA
jgi:hypothetical protein